MTSAVGVVVALLDLDPAAEREVAPTFTVDVDFVFSVTPPLLLAEDVGLGDAPVLGGRDIVVIFTIFKELGWDAPETTVLIGLLLAKSTLVGEVRVSVLVEGGLGKI